MPALVDALRRARASARLRVRRHVGDARAFELGRAFALAIAPMQVAAAARRRRRPRGCSRASARHLRPGGLLAAALADPFEGIRDGEDAAAAAGRARGGRLGLLEHAGRRPRDGRRQRADRAPAPGGLAVRRAHRVEERSRSTRAGARASSSRRPRGAAGLRAAERRRVPPTEELRGQRRRDAGGAHDADAARLLALPGADEHLRRPRQHRGAARPLRVARDRASSCARRASASGSTPSATTSSTWAAARTATRRCGAGHGRDQARRASRRGGDATR